jgi:hypothetical protein
MKSTFIISLILILCSAYIYFFYSSRYINYQGSTLNYSTGLQYYDSGKATIHVFGIALRHDKGIPTDSVLVSQNISAQSKVQAQTSFDKTPFTFQIIIYRVVQNFVYFFGLVILIVLAILLFISIKWIKGRIGTDTAKEN